MSTQNQPERNQIRVTASKPEKRITKYTVEEFWESLYYECCDADDDYDRYLHIVSTIDGSEIKIAIKDIVHEAAKYQNNS